MPEDSNYSKLLAGHYSMLTKPVKSLGHTLKNFRKPMKPAVDQKKAILHQYMPDLMSLEKLLVLE